MIIISLHLIIKSEICIHNSRIIYRNCKLLCKYVSICIAITNLNNVSFSSPKFPRESLFPLLYIIMLLDTHCLRHESHKVFINICNSMISQPLIILYKTTDLSCFKKKSFTMFEILLIQVNIHLLKT